MSEKKLKKGDEVSWKSRNGSTHGTVEKKLTQDTKVGGHKVKADSDDPQYLVKSDKTGSKAAHKPEALKRR